MPQDNSKLSCCPVCEGPLDRDNDLCSARCAAVYWKRLETWFETLPKCIEQEDPHDDPDPFI